MSLLLGLDVSKNRMGWALVDVDSGALWRPAPHGCEPLDRDGGGFLEDQVRDALRAVSWRVYDKTEHVVTWVREEPMTRFVSIAKDHGAVCAVSDAGCRRLYPWANFWVLKGTEWRPLVGLKGNARKEDVALWAHMTCHAQDVDPPKSQDAADAIGIALAAVAQLRDSAMTAG